MSEEQFIIKFYSCDNEEQFLKDVYHNLNTLQQENQQLKKQLENNKLNHKQLKDLEKVQLLNSYQVEKLNKKQEQLDLYKSVIDEAIKYINHATSGADRSPIEDSWLYNLYETRYILLNKANIKVSEEK